jgi:tRNA threonylcarbamoyladenosine biosynthesis protein TsaE
MKNLGSTDEVSSPTYAIVNEYNSPKGKVFILTFIASKK